MVSYVKRPGRRDPERRRALRHGGLPRRLRRRRGGREPRGPPDQDGGQPRPPGQPRRRRPPRAGHHPRPLRPAAGSPASGATASRWPGAPSSASSRRWPASLAKDGGARLRVLAEPTSSPTAGRPARRGSWPASPGPASTAGARSPTTPPEGAALAFGRPLDAELPAGRRRRHPLARRRLPGHRGRPPAPGPRLRPPARPARAGMNRLYVAEASFTVTGGAADHRLRMRASEVLGFGRAVAAALATHHGLAAAGARSARPLAGDRNRAGRGGGRGPGAGARPRRSCWPGRRQPAAVHALAHGPERGARQRRRHRAPTASRSLLDPASGPGRLEALAGEIAGRPGRHAGHHRLEPGLHRARPTSTSPRCSPRSPTSSTWPRARTRPPAPPAGGGRGATRSRAGATCAAATAPPPSSSRSSRRSSRASPSSTCWPPSSTQGRPAAPARAGARRLDRRARRRAPGFDRAWERWLAAGVVPGTGRGRRRAGEPRSTSAAWPPRSGRVPPAARRARGRLRARRQGPRRPLRRQRLAAGAARTRSPSSPGTTPPSLSPATAAAAGRRDRRAWSTLDARAAAASSAPVLVLPGHADDAVTLPLGYGRTVAGPAGAGVGFDAYALRAAAAPWFDARPRARRPPAGEHALAQHPGALLHGGARHRARLRRGRAAPRARPRARGAARPAAVAAASSVDYSKEEYRWGMAIDLSKCTGCGACVLACQAENNIPVVGKEQVLDQPRDALAAHRPLLPGPAADPETVTQPLACVALRDRRPASTSARSTPPSTPTRG